MLSVTNNKNLSPLQKTKEIKKHKEDNNTSHYVFQSKLCIHSSFTYPELKSSQAHHFYVVKFQTSVRFNSNFILFLAKFSEFVNKTNHS